MNLSNDMYLPYLFGYLAGQSYDLISNFGEVKKFGGYLICQRC